MVSTLALAALSGAFTRPRLYAAPYPGAAAGKSRAWTWPAQPTAVARAMLSVPKIGPRLGKAYGEIAGVLAEQGRAPAGPPFTRYHPLRTGRHNVEAGFPVTTAIEPI